MKLYKDSSMVYIFKTRCVCATRMPSVATKSKITLTTNLPRDRDHHMYIDVYQSVEFVGSSVLQRQAAQVGNGHTEQHMLSNTSHLL